VKRYDYTTGGMRIPTWCRLYAGMLLNSIPQSIPRDSYDSKQLENEQFSAWEAAVLPLNYTRTGWCPAGVIASSGSDWKVAFPSLSLTPKDRLISRSLRKAATTCSTSHRLARPRPSRRSGTGLSRHPGARARKRGNGTPARAAGAGRQHAGAGGAVDLGSLQTA
jgi:hypothetical protein